jgi:hypothetical protein
VFLYSYATTYIILYIGYRKFPESIYLAQAGIKKGLMIMAVVPKPNDGAQGLNISANPTAAALLQEGFHQVYEPPHASKFDIVECAAHLKTIESQQHLRFLGVLPCREAAVDYSDILGALLGLTSVNDLGLASARRDKGLMKSVVANAGLRVAKFARLTDGTGADVKSAIEELELEYPVVVKTPRGFSTMDVYICKDEAEAVLHSGEIVRSVGPDGRKTQYALLEEFLGGDEFAVNLIASPATARAVRVTDIWLYHKVNVAGTMVNTFQEMVDPTDKKFASIVKYAEGVCRAVGIKYGVGHCEIKATYDESKDKYVEPVMIEIAGRMAGGRKAAMAEATISGWFPFEAMIDAHCGFPIKMPTTFRPTKVAAQAYVPSDKAGIIKSVTGDNFDRLTSYHSHTIMRTVGDKVKRSTDLISFAAFVWLIGDGEDVRRDAMQAIHEYKVEVESA